jgi:hypothetical protein
MIATYVFERERFADYFNLITLPFGGNEENHENYGYDNRFPGPELNPEPPRLQNKCLWILTVTHLASYPVDTGALSPW